MKTKKRKTGLTKQNKKNVVFKLGELFSGPGGMACGALRAKVEHKGVIYSIEHAWANDYDLDSCKTYMRNICPNNGHSVICKDVKELDISSLPPIDCFAYGFPCNDFSVVGEKKGFNGEFGSLYTYGIKILNHFKPKFFVAENVKGITSSNEGNAFLRILNDLAKAGNGYELTTHLYKFEDYGVPQTRHRIIIVGIDKTLKKKLNIPQPTSANKKISVFEALTIPPIPEIAPNNEFTSQSKTVVERLKHTKPGENAWTADLPKHLKLNVKGARLSHIYKRLKPDEPSYTITGSGGGGTHVYHWSENRALINRERARIQTFPDNFIFEGRKESVRKQIGMAVPPQISEYIFTCILKTLLDIPYPYIPAKSSLQINLFEDM